ncbi:hypothetical protein NIES23_33100 [Trichormus variabilis NIES-23]|uniref:Uncharacterized protein n=1 Tax=Trichormus variabilis NIES-23 TaxID=1973479 RepID=A0A1Z4KNF9_ANAVA|nr:hypothetical protein NIES23_33100 [Trichormus variabilis NIES-23]
MRDELRLLYKAEYRLYPSPSPVGDAARSLLPVGYGDANANGNAFSECVFAPTASGTPSGECVLALAGRSPTKIIPIISNAGKW